MNPEKISKNIEAVSQKFPEVEILPPGTLHAEPTANHMISLLEEVYVKHGITSNKDEVIDDIKSGKVQTWLAKDEGKIVATASLIDNGDSNEVGRAVSIKGGKGTGKQLMSLAVLEHQKTSPDKPLVAEVRVAKDFKWITSGEATQRICFDFLQLVPHALAPLFSHGSPERNEVFALASSDVEDGKTIMQRVFEATNGRDTAGIAQKLKVVMEEPFRLIVPDPEGSLHSEVIEESTKVPVCSLFEIEATDQNMPLIGTLFANPDVLISGVGRSTGQNGKPIVLFTTFSEEMAIAPTEISSVLPRPLREDMQNIADKINDRDKSWHKRIKISDTPSSY